MASFIIRNIKRTLRFFIAASYVNWILYISSYFKRKNEAFVLYPVFWRGLITNEMEHVLLLLGVVQKFYPGVRIISGKRSLSVKDKIIFYNPSELFNYSRKINYTEGLCELVDKLEANENVVYYGKHELLFWENKSFMYNKFHENSIPHPLTQIIPLDVFDETQLKVPFPLLVKEEHSFASRGVHKVDNRSQLISLIKSVEFTDKNVNVILQELLDMRKDLRVIIIGNEIVLHYWRVNTEEHWQPTSTSFGSGVDFVSFPNEWKDFIVDCLHRLNLSTGAFDIAWRKDELTSTPLILEVSPSYQPNPPVITSKFGLTYGEYKKKFLLFNSWDQNYLKMIYDFKYKLVRVWLNK